MTKLPYGGYELEDASNAPWLNLFSIAESLEKGEPLRPNLAYWLAKAIRSADMKESKLLLNLGFGKGFARGGQEKIDKGWLIYGQKVVELEDEAVVAVGTRGGVGAKSGSEGGRAAEVAGDEDVAGRIDRNSLRVLFLGATDLNHPLEYSRR